MGVGAVSLPGGIGCWEITVYYSAYLWHYDWVGLVRGVGRALLRSYQG